MLKIIPSFLRHFGLFRQENFLKLEEMFFWGTEYGGWHIPKDFQLKPQDVCYFFGAGEDISFDCEVVMHFPCEVHILDPTPKAVAHYNSLVSATNSGEKFFVNNGSQKYEINVDALKRLHFHPWGGGGKDEELRFYLPKNPDHVSCSILNLQKTEEYFIAQCHTVRSIMNKLNHERIAFMKMDVEGAEYQILRAMIADSVLPRLLAIEFDELHTPIDAGARSRVNASIDSLKSVGYTLIYKNAHNLTFRLCA